MNAKNPKEAAARARWRQLACVPFAPLMGVGAAFLEGALKYGPFNWRRTPVSASVYIEAAMGHLIAYWEGEDIDPDSGVCHIAKAIAGLLILEDARLRGGLVDDRPPASDVASLRASFSRQVQDIYARACPEGARPMTILLADLEALDACKASREAFALAFPDGADSWLAVAAHPKWKSVWRGWLAWQLPSSAITHVQRMMLTETSDDPPHWRGMVAANAPASPDFSLDDRLALADASDDPPFWRDCVIRMHGSAEGAQ